MVLLIREPVRQNHYVIVFILVDKLVGSAQGQALAHLSGKRVAFFQTIIKSGKSRAGVDGILVLDTKSEHAASGKNRSFLQHRLERCLELGLAFELRKR
ncbi:hypothetical protein HWV62_2611 [Athelia sp. TMB]|nr:hypothetical protein HWV62_2611 [Athelia sp. TMB]